MNLYLDQKALRCSTSYLFLLGNLIPAIVVKIASDISLIIIIKGTKQET